MKRRSVLKPYSDSWSSLSRLIHPLLVALTGWAAYTLYLEPKPGFGPMPLRYQMALLVGLLITIVIFSRFQVYRPWRGLPMSAELKNLSSAWVAVVIILVIIVFLAKLGNEYSRVWMVSWAVTAWLVLIGFRMIVRLVLRAGRRKGWNLRHIVIAGTPDLIQHVIQRLRLAPWAGFQVQAVFADDKITIPSTAGDMETHSLNELKDYVKTHSPDQVWIAFNLEDLTKQKTLLKDIQDSSPVPVRLVPDFYDFSMVNYSISEVAGMPVFTLNESPLIGVNRFAKRAEDILGSLLLLMLTSPLFLLIGLLIRGTSQGPVFYRQKRVSWNGKVFSMLKFRTMPHNIERETGPRWASRGDSRPTPVGKWLRKTSLDELPQFINVLKGDMSLVGPRPERPVFVEEFRKYIPDYMQKHLVKAGITGWAQISGLRGDTDLKMRIEADLFYIENWSLWFDLKILLLTPFKGLFSANAY